MPEILVLCPGRESRRIVESQLRNICTEAAYFTTRSELRIAAAEAGVKAIVSDLFDGDGRPTAASLRDLGHEFPELKIVVSYDPSPAALDDVLEAATGGSRMAFAARPFNDLGHLLAPMLDLGSARPPSEAEGVLLRVIPQAETAAARRCLTLAAVNPAHRISIRQIARFCDTTERTLYRHLGAIASPKLVLNALAWVQANYLLTGLHWRARQVAEYFGYPRPAYLIDLLADYIESGLWNFGLDASVDGIAAITKESASHYPSLNREQFRSRGEIEVTRITSDVAFLPGMSWSPSRRNELGQRILTLLNRGLAPMDIVRRLWRSYDVAPGHLYQGVMQIVDAVRAGGLVEEPLGIG